MSETLIWFAVFALLLAAIWVVIYVVFGPLLCDMLDTWEEHKQFIDAMEKHFSEYGSREWRLGYRAGERFVDDPTSRPEDYDTKSDEWKEAFIHAVEYKSGKKPKYKW